MNNHEVAAALLKIAARLVNAKSNKVSLKVFEAGQSEKARDWVIAQLSRKRLVYRFSKGEEFALIGGVNSAKDAFSMLRRAPDYVPAPAKLEQLERITSVDEIH